MLISCGHDLNHLLDSYTVEQLEIMSASIFQHRMTTLKIGAFALGGKEAASRVPQQESKPKGVTPEQELVQREKALAQLGVLQGMVAQASKMGGVRSQTPPQALGGAKGAQDGGHEGKAFADALQSIPRPKGPNK